MHTLFNLLIATGFEYTVLIAIFYHMIVSCNYNAIQSRDIPSLLLRHQGLMWYIRLLNIREQFLTSFMNNTSVPCLLFCLNIIYCSPSSNVTLITIHGSLFYLSLPLKTDSYSNLYLCHTTILHISL